MTLRIRDGRLLPNPKVRNARKPRHKAGLPVKRLENRLSRRAPHWAFRGDEVQADRANARRDIQAGIAFDAERLKRDRAVEPADQRVRAYSDARCSARRRAT